jgi:GH15 family glucan-1,4-alpha-glucosidase
MGRYYKIMRSSDNSGHAKKKIPSHRGNLTSASSVFEIPVRVKYKPITGYGIIGNTRTIALVSYDGSIDWCCLPKFDSPSVFASILDYKIGGRWSIAPLGSKGKSTQRYIENTNILQTEFTTGKSRVILTDFMPCSIHHEEAWASPPEIHRIVEGVEGSISMRMRIEPRFEYGLCVPEMQQSGMALSMRSVKDEMVLASTTGIRLARKGVALADFKITKGEKQFFVLSYGEYDPRRVEEYQTHSQLLRTEAFWKHWVGNLKYRGRWKEQVFRSALTLKLLTYSPTGAILAAPTTSLPEAIGGGRNWDYRFSWIRDSANSLWAFHLVGDRSEAEKFLHWLIDNNPSLDLDLRIMYSINGNANIKESILTHLEGYRGSSPVRIGNAAVKQFQMDAYGYMLDALYFSSMHGANVSEDMYYRFVKPLARYICENWKKPGHGIWEIRGWKDRYVYTEAWCYSGLDRAVKIAKITKHSQDIPLWLSTMKEIKREILDKGWDNKKKSFVMSLKNRNLDSANLLLPLIGFIEGTNKKMELTVDAIRKELGHGALLYRYKINDRFKGKEGAFLLCSFWLVACLAKIGRLEEAMEAFDELLGYSNHLGLYSEEVDPSTGEGLGNFPQAFSHMGLIMAASELDRLLDTKFGSIAS